jgi:hypothetical protein
LHSGGEQASIGVCVGEFLDSVCGDGGEFGVCGECFEAAPIELVGLSLEAESPAVFRLWGFAFGLVLLVEPGGEVVDRGEVEEGDREGFELFGGELVEPIGGGRADVAKFLIE